ncbi:malto-oligosyltrehalose synthase [uncultured Microbacterium sp.]|uniref:malto-oligosyltrehalose synthase n=1 Tax=uncultured Microbacterium sp. TaxID=191216 RepID=UPI0028D7D60B|nr:malto-oligosyltrehalose synthase [uncultured Microbacterium sp.]
MARTPRSTYRLQIRRDFDLDAAARVTGYLRDLGVSWAYLSPLLKATDGSDHGYDVVDPSQVDPARGGAAGLGRFASAAREAGLGILIDTVPNHMGISQPAQNSWWWDVLTHGRASRYAEAFDIDWDFGGGRVRVPILGASTEEVIADGQVRIDPGTSGLAPHGVVRFYDEHVLPLSPGSVTAGSDLADTRVIEQVLARQHWEAIFWRREAAELNYRRFFAVTTLAGVRVEIPWVFDESHTEVLRWIREGLADGLRVDHPDGLLDPGAYLERLAAATGGAYVLVEKILEHGEELPGWWETDGTTGYDALGEIDRVLIDPAGEAALSVLDAQLRGDDTRPYSEVIHDTKRMIADTIQGAEIARLVRELPSNLQGPAAHDALAELLACFPVYRSYLPAGRRHLDDAAAAAVTRRPDLTGTIEQLVPLLADPARDVARRFQQTTGPVMAKGVEDTAFYRYGRLGSLTEVGGDPSVFALTVEGFHRAQAQRHASWPLSMTTLSTHDTKRGEDVRARLDVLAEVPGRWAAVLAEMRERASTGHAAFDNLLFQAVLGSWPASRERLHAYAEKASREAAEATGWWDPDPAFEQRLHATVDAVFDDPQLRRTMAEFVAEVAAAGWSNGLSAKLLQLTAPGVPDVYQGSELWETSLVDPDNRREVDFDARRRMLAELDSGFSEGRLPRVDETAAAKLLVTSRALRLRRDRPDLFTMYRPMTVVGPASDHAIAFDRGGAVAVATRLPVGLAARGGWGDTVLLRHSGPTTDALTGRTFRGSTIPLHELLATYPVALLVPAENEEDQSA